MLKDLKDAPKLDLTQAQTCLTQAKFYVTRFFGENLCKTQKNGVLTGHKNGPTQA